MRDTITVFVIYEDWGAYDGCQAPRGVYSSKEKAALAIYEADEYWRDKVKIRELEMDAPPLSNQSPKTQEPANA